jgi:hypothetical protein
MRYIFTFGFSHCHPVTGERLRDCYVQSPEGMDFHQARAWMIDHFGDYWSFQYEDTSSDDAGIQQFRLTELTDIPSAEDEW